MTLTVLSLPLSTFLVYQAGTDLVENSICFYRFQLDDVISMGIIGPVLLQPISFWSLALIQYGQLDKIDDYSLQLGWHW